MKKNPTNQRDKKYKIEHTSVQLHICTLLFTEVEIPLLKTGNSYPNMIFHRVFNTGSGNNQPLLLTVEFKEKNGRTKVRESKLAEITG